jgi:OFA family oxalate/formate antiporter-like MFS transporter
MDRWRVAIGGAVLMACLGTVYAWSVFTQPLQAAFGWSASQATLPFSVAIFFLGIGAVLGGRWQDRAGPRPVALTGAALWAAGNLAAGLGTGRLGLPWLVATYGVAGGLGLGLGYVTPVAAATKWFPGRRGLGSGVVVMGFGLGAFAYAHLLRSGPRLEGPALFRAFTLSGVAFAVLGGLAAAWIRNPPPAAGTGSGPAPPVAPPTGHAPAEMLATPQFWALWAMLFVNVTAGILFISNAVPILRELTGATAAAAAAAYGTIALANALGRFFWGAVSDRAGRRVAFALVYLSQAAVFLAVGRVHSLPAAAALFALVLLCYGGGFGVMPSFVADWFGTRHLGANYGLVLLAWSAAGLAGPGFVSWVKDRGGSYAVALPWAAALLLAATLLPATARAPRPPRPGAAPPATPG